MLLTKKQYQHQHEIFNKIAGIISSLQEDAKEKYNRDEDKTSYTRGLMIGKSTAFEDCYNLLRREADSAYQKEPVAADTLLDSSLEHLGDHLKAIKSIISTIENSANLNDIKSSFVNFNNVTAVMEAIINSAKIIVRQTEPVIA
jgi:hypothetical protein